MAMLVLGAEHDDLRVFIYLYVVPGWPVKQIVSIDCLVQTPNVGTGTYRLLVLETAGSYRRLPKD